MFSSQIGLKPLSLVCRSLSTMLHSGVAIQQSFRVAADKTSDPRCRRALSGVSDAIRRGEDVHSAMSDQEAAFPELMVEMVGVAEKTGGLPEVLNGLADHYDNSIRLRRDFYSSIAWPMFQLFAAIFVVALLIWILGMIGSADVLGWGLVGAGGAMTWLSWTLGSLACLFLFYKLIVGSLSGRKFLDPIFMRLPVVGGCMQSFAIARFSWAFALTQQSGMGIEESLDASGRATNNGAFLAKSPHIWHSVREGNPLHAALRDSGLFPADYLHMVDVAEQSGTVPEMLDHLSPQFEEQARRSLNTLTAILGWLIWLCVAAFIIFLIFSIIMRIYINPMREAVKDALG